MREYVSMGDLSTPGSLDEWSEERVRERERRKRVCECVCVYTHLSEKKRRSDGEGARG